jgi:hypothetical protein
MSGVLRVPALDLSILAVSERLFGGAQRLTVPLHAFRVTGAVGGQLETFKERCVLRLWGS